MFIGKYIHWFRFYLFFFSSRRRQTRLSGDWSSDVCSSDLSPHDPGDDAVLAHAHAQGRTLVTLDKDFGELAIVKARPRAGIVRLVGLGLAAQGPVLLEIIRKHGEGLERGAIVTATTDRLRVRQPG